MGVVVKKERKSDAEKFEYIFWEMPTTRGRGQELHGLASTNERFLIYKYNPACDNALYI